MCMKAKPFWRDICTILTEIIKINIPLHPELCLLGNFTSTPEKTSSLKNTTDIFENSFSVWPGNTLQWHGNLVPSFRMRDGPRRWTGASTWRKLHTVLGNNTTTHTTIFRPHKYTSHVKHFIRVLCIIFIQCCVVFLFLFFKCLLIFFFF